MSNRQQRNDLQDILFRFDLVDLRLHHLVLHAHHLEELIQAVGGTSGDQAKIQAINAQLAESKQKLKAAIEALPHSGVPPQS